VSSIFIKTVVSSLQLQTSISVQTWTLIQWARVLRSVSYTLTVLGRTGAVQMGVVIPVLLLIPCPTAPPLWCVRRSRRTPWVSVPRSVGSVEKGSSVAQMGVAMCVQRGFFLPHSALLSGTKC
jgi:hypothetical protein